MTSSNRFLMEFVQQAPDDQERFRALLMSEPGVEEVFLETNTDASFAAETVVAIVILASAGLAAITRIADWVRDRNDCLLVIDARGGDLRIVERCDVRGRRGHVIIITSADQQVVIKRNDAILDLQSLVAHAIDSSAQAVAELAKAAGADAHIERPSLDM